MILALNSGRTISAVARSSNHSRTTVYRWLRLYQHHRDPWVLSNLHSSREIRVAPEAAMTLNAMSGGREARGALNLDQAARRKLWQDAHIASDPVRRKHAAILWALDRGIRDSHVAHVAGMSRQAVHRIRRKFEANQAKKGSPHETDHKAR